MSLMTEHEVKCMIDDALKVHMDKYVTSVRPYNGDTQSISIVMSDGNVVTMDVSGLIADVLSKTKDVHVVAWTEYNPANNTGQLLMSNGTKVPVDMSAVIADAIASIVFPEIPKGLDCEAVGNLPKRAYKTGDSVLVHGTDGVCARVDFVDDVLEFPALASFPATGEAGKIYIDASTNKTYRWNGAGYTEISASAGIAVQDEGSVLTTAATSLNFIGTAITATSAGGAVSVNVDAVTPAQMATTLVNYADTNTATGNVLVPTGTPTGNGTNYATNSNGELFVYNKVTGQWQLISMGYRMTSVASNSVPIYNRVPYVVASFIMPRDGGIQLSAFTLCQTVTRSTDLDGLMHIDLAVSLNDSFFAYATETNAPNYSVNQGYNTSVAGYIDVNAGDVVEVILVMENALVNEVVLNSHNIRLYYVS